MALALITACLAAVLFFVLLDGATAALIAATLLALAAWVSHGFAIPDQ